MNYKTSYKANRAKPLLFASFAISAAMIRVEAAPQSVTLVKDGQAQSAIYVAPEVMADDKKISPVTTPFAEREAEADRRLLRDSVKDLSHYLQKMSGAAVEVLTTPPGDKRLPIYIGTLAAQKFGPVKKTTGGQSFRVVASQNGIGLYGESDQSSSYAIYELLDRLGCRWFMPSELGEEIPHRSTLVFPVLDFSGAPGTLFRNIWYADADFKRRVRSSAGYDDSHYIAAGHALEGYVTKEQREQHPEWRAIIGGKPDPMRLKWSNPGVQQAVADAIIARLDKQYVPSISISPYDGASFDESDDTKWDAGDTDPVMGGPSITDRYVKFCNIIAEKVTKKYPNVKLGFLAYAQYTQPPLREKLHPNLVPMFAPINYCRAHAITDDCPSRSRMKAMIEAWGKAAPGGVAYYNYMFNLAEYSAPYPMIHQMKEELPIIYANNVKYWMPEGMSNFEQVLPGLYLTIRKAWNPQADSDAILNEFFARFYGAAEKPMRKYWTLFDDQWTKVDEHSGSGWSYARRFTPEFMQEARATMDEALQAASTPSEYRRVEMQDASLKQFELWMRMVWDLNDGKLLNLGPQSELWMSGQLYLANAYGKQYAFSKTYWSPTAAGRWFNLFFQPAYLDATRVAKNFTVISPPLREWKYFVDREKAGEAQGLFKPEYSDGDWKTTDIAVERWATLGIPDYFGPMWYRQSVKVPAVPAGKKVYLWVSQEDGDVKVWVNGRPILYVNAKGETQDAFHNGYGTPVSFDITAAIKPGAQNQIAIEGTRVFINELGTGGLLGPVYLYREK
jgi:hypothetical protein